MKSRLAFAVTVFAIAGGLAYAAQDVTVIGPITPGNCAAFFSTTQIKDAGVNCASGGGGTGTVTSVSLALPFTVFNVSGSPVTNNGTLTGTFINQSGNTFFASPVNGSVGQPAFRTVSSADLPLPTAGTVGAVFAGGPTTSQYVFAVTTTGGVLLKQILANEISGVVSGAQLPIAGPSTFGVIEANAPLASNWVTGWSAGVPQVSQPAFTDIAGQIAPGQLPSSGNNTVLSNITGATNTPSANSLSAVLDSALGSTAFSVIYRGPSTWTVLTPGVQGQFLATSGASNAPVWANAAGGGTLQSLTPGTSMFLSTNPCTVSCVLSVVSTANNTIFANTSGGSAPPAATSPSVVLDIFSSAQGSILQRGASIWAALAPGSAGQVLTSQGPGATNQWAGLNISRVTSSTVIDIPMNNTSNFFDGPATAQGTSGTWFASGTVSVSDTAGSAQYTCKLWDGTTVIASGSIFSTAAGGISPIALSGILTSPAGNIRISCRDFSSTSGKILTSTTSFGSVSNASTLTVIRLQ